MTDNISSIYKIKNPYIKKEDADTNRIPKILHNIWLPGYDKLDEEAKIMNLNIKQINPDWDFMIWDESSISGVIKKYPDMYALYMNCSKMSGAVLTSTCKAEIAKYVILKEYGGIYFDFEYQCTKPFDNLVSFDPTSIFVTYENRDWLEYIFSFGVEKYSSSWIGVCKNHPVWEHVFTNLKKCENKYELFEAWNKTLQIVSKQGFHIKNIGDDLNKSCKYVPNTMTIKTHVSCSSMNENENESFLSYIWSYIKCHYKQLILLLICILIVIGIHRLNDYNSTIFAQPSFPGMPGFGGPSPPSVPLQKTTNKGTGKSLKRGRSRK